MTHAFLRRLRKGTAYEFLTVPFKLTLRSSHLCPITAAGGDRYESAHVPFGELRLQSKRDKALLSAYTRDYLPRFYTEISPVSSVSIGGTHQVNLRLSLPFSEREKSPVQTVFASAGADASTVSVILLGLL